MGTANDHPGTLVRRAAWLAMALAVTHAAHAASAPPPSEVAHCAVSLSDRFPPSCTSRLALSKADEFPGADADAATASGQDDPDDRAKQIETMNQQLRMERRRKDTLQHLYPDEAAYDAARLQALAETDRPIRAAEIRVEDLTRERRRLGEGASLYVGRQLPADLRNGLQSADFALQQAMATLRNCREQRALVSKNYDDELVVLRKIWAAQQRGAPALSTRISTQSLDIRVSADRSSSS